MISPYSFRLFLHTHIHFTLSYSGMVADYLRKILFNHSKIIYVSATMSIIDNYGTLFTAQTISAKQVIHNVMKTSTQSCDRGKVADSLGRTND